MVPLAADDAAMNARWDKLAKEYVDQFPAFTPVSATQLEITVLIISWTT